MKVVVRAPIILVALFAAATEGGERKEVKGDKIKVNMDYLEKTWGIKYKSLTAEPAQRAIAPNRTNPMIQVRILLEFSKDVEDVKAMQQRLSGFDSASSKDIIEKTKLWFYLFDEDNVSLGKAHLIRIEGEASGKKNDAFRAVVQFHPRSFERARRMEARPAEPNGQAGK